MALNRFREPIICHISHGDLKMSQYTPEFQASRPPYMVSAGVFILAKWYISSYNITHHHHVSEVHAEQQR
jgi:hypothetical protein